MAPSLQDGMVRLLWRFFAGPDEIKSEKQRRAIRLGACFASCLLAWFLAVEAASVAQGANASHAFCEAVWIRK